MPSTRWTTAPTRREITLVLFSLIIFIVFFNLNASLRVIGLQPTASFRKFGLGSDPGFDPDGRRPQAFRDDLENQIFGEWEWEEGQVAGGGPKKSKAKNALPGPPVHNEFIRWENDIPVSKLIKHVPGYTIIDSIILANGTFYIVANDASHFPSLDTIGSSHVDPSYAIHWQIISTDEAQQALEAYAGRVHGVTWLSMDDESDQDSLTLPSFWRTYSSLDLNITSSGATILPSPYRIGFPRITTFLRPSPEGDSNAPRTRSSTGFHQNLLKTAFPSVGMMYAEDWADLNEMNLPFLLERVVVSDRSASARSLSNEGKGTPPWSSPFTALETSPNWWHPVRKALARNLQVDDESKEKVVTYISRQDEAWGPRLRDEDHITLLDELHSLGAAVHVVTSATKWEDLMRSILRSKVVLGVYGEQIFDGIYMKPSPYSTLIEFWPSGAFTKDRELPAQSIGLKYMACWTDRIFSGDLLPPVSPPPDARAFRQIVSIDSRAVTQSIRDLLRQMD